MAVGPASEPDWQYIKYWQAVKRSEEFWEKERECYSPRTDLNVLTEPAKPAVMPHLKRYKDESKKVEDRG